MCVRGSWKEKPFVSSVLYSVCWAELNGLGEVENDAFWRTGEHVQSGQLLVEHWEDRKWGVCSKINSWGGIKKSARLTHCKD